MVNDKAHGADYGVLMVTNGDKHLYLVFCEDDNKLGMGQDVRPMGPQLLEMFYIHHR